jgi:phosphatidylethanolamine-binding protein (PEBP) family uncharacterized protein
MKTILHSTCCAVALTCAFSAFAHDSHRHDNSSAPSSAPRIWKDTTGIPIHEGSFVAAQEDKLIVENQDGDFLSIEIERLGEADRELIAQRVEQARQLNTQPIRQTAAAGGANIPAGSSAYLGLLQSSFGAFFPKVKTRSDARFFYVESDSIPDHQMMVGITAWQQQVPIPQPYTGANAWQIPLHPVKASNPMSAKEHFFRGAIALAANGVPIFNPIKNDGRTDTVVAGELDKWGGHCGRADDYHYHIAPTHLQQTVGAGNPVAFGLDGIPVFGLTEPDGSPVGQLDWMNGHTDKNGAYHYHATRTYPYLIGGFYGEVVESGGQVDPQPRARGVRPYTQPLRGAKITDFTGSLKSGYSLKYSQNGRDGFVNYKVLDNNNVAFKFIDSSGRTTTETFEPRQRGGGGGGGDERRGKGKGDRGRGQGGQRPPRRDGDRPPPRRPGDRSDAQQSTQQPILVAQNQDRRQGQGGNRGQEQGRGGGTRGGGGKGDGNLILSALDANRDGELSQTELRNTPVALRKLDKNGDGQLSREETRGQGGGRNQSRGREQGGRPSSDRGDARPGGNPSAPVATPYIINPKHSGEFKLTSPAVADSGPLPKEYNGDGAGATLPLEWKGAPAGSKSFALVMDHLARGPEMKCYWTMWDIPSSVTSLPKNVQGVGTLGATWKRGATFVAPHSQGGGAKTYTLHVYALSKAPQFSQPPGEVTREVLLAAIKDSILDSAELNVIYTAAGYGERRGSGGPGGKGRSQNRPRQ